MKCDFSEKCGRNCQCNIPVVTIPSTRGKHKLINAFRSSGSLSDKKPIQKYDMVTEVKVDELEANLEYSS
jgi:hypothetical protein